MAKSYDWQPNTIYPPHIWHCDMCWCPSQCYYHIEHNGKHWVLYLRWRHNNPWTAAIMENAYSSSSLHFDSTTRHDVKDFPHFEQHQTKLAQFALLREWVKRYRDKPNETHWLRLLVESNQLATKLDDFRYRDHDRRGCTVEQLQMFAQDRHWRRVEKFNKLFGEKLHIPYWYVTEVEQG